MSTARRRFIFQAIDPEYGCSVLEALFSVEQVEEVRVLLGSGADNDPELRGFYALDAQELAAITGRFGVAFDPDGREVCLCSWHSLCEVPYLVHTNYELPLLIDGRKALARMGDVYPPERFFGEEYFDRYVAQGLLRKEVVLEPFAEPLRLNDGRVFDGLRTVYFARTGEEWRIAAAKLVWAAAAKVGWNEAFERLEGMLYGYEEWQIDWWMARYRKRVAKAQEPFDTKEGVA